MLNTREDTSLTRFQHLPLHPERQTFVPIIQNNHAMPAVPRRIPHRVAPLQSYVDDEFYPRRHHLMFFVRTAATLLRHVQKLTSMRPASSNENSSRSNTISPLFAFFRFYFAAFSSCIFIFRRVLSSLVITSDHFSLHPLPCIPSNMPTSRRHVSRSQLGRQY